MSEPTLPMDPVWEAEQRARQNDKEVDARAQKVIDQITRKGGGVVKWEVRTFRSFGWSTLTLYKDGTQVYVVGGIDDMDYYAEKAREWINNKYGKDAQ